ncbi:MAG: CoA-acylating methylmalonate-semialdehyde dehydrogenase [Sandaracinus sp.]|nr:CoA-acylating methylmalonate-semialdehyde dehydrogenase [Sandaracinus sp.]
MKQVVLPKAPIEVANLVGGEHVAAKGGVREVVSPYTGEVIGRVGLSTVEDVGRAVAAAKDAAKRWRAVPIKERTQALFRYRELLLAHLEELGNLAAIESGKTVDEGAAGVMKGVEVIEFALSLQNLDDGAVLEVSRGVTCEVRREPMGVVVGITPFNFPAMVPLWLYPIAIACGNAFVLKPSEKVPLTSHRVGQLMTEAGFPPGVFTVVNGDRVAVEALIDHPDVSVVTFVGSTAVARAVYRRATGNDKRALCLGGAKNHLVVVPDADPEVTIDGVLRSFTGCAGQRCMAGSLLVAVGDVEPILDGIVERASQMVLGRDMGAIIDRPSLDRLVAAIGRAKDDGVRIRLDGRSPEVPDGFSGGHWLGATILDGAKPGMECAQHELFGPVLTIVRVPTLEAALALQSESPYGNAQTVFTTSGAVARFVADRSEAGMIGINVGVPVPREPFAFGGTKQSRFGQGDITGRPALELWTQTKKITSKWQLQSDSNWMS